MRVAIGSDHAGFELKEAVKTFLAAEHHEVVDVGTYSQDPVDYPDYAQAVGAAALEHCRPCHARRYRPPRVMWARAGR